MTKKVLVILYLVFMEMRIAGQDLVTIPINKFNNYSALDLTVYPETIGWIGGDVLVIPALGGLNLLDTKKMEAAFIKTPGVPYIFQAGNKDHMLSIEWSTGVTNFLNILSLRDGQPVFKKKADYSQEGKYDKQENKWFYDDTDINGYAKIDMEKEEIIIRWFQLDGASSDLSYPIRQVRSAYFWKNGAEYRALPWSFEADKEDPKLSSMFGKEHPDESKIDYPGFFPAPDIEFSIMDYSHLYNVYLLSCSYDYGTYKVSIIDEQAYIEKLFSAPIMDSGNEANVDIADGALILTKYSYLSIPKEIKEKDEFYLDASETVFYSLQVNTYAGKTMGKIEPMMVENNYVPYTKRKFITNWKKTRLAIVGYNHVSRALELMLLAIEKSAIVNVDSLRFRDTPKTTGIIFRNLVKGEKVTILDISDNLEMINGIKGYWTYVRLSDGATGWVFGAYLSEADSRNAE